MPFTLTAGLLLLALGVANGKPMGSSNGNIMIDGLNIDCSNLKNSVVDGKSESWCCDGCPASAAIDTVDKSCCKEVTASVMSGSPSASASSVLPTGIEAAPARAASSPPGPIAMPVGGNDFPISNGNVMIDGKKIEGSPNSGRASVPQAVPHDLNKTHDDAPGKQVIDEILTDINDANSSYLGEDDFDDDNDDDDATNVVSDNAGKDHPKNDAGETPARNSSGNGRVMIDGKEIKCNNFKNIDTDGKSESWCCDACGSAADLSQIDKSCCVAI